MINQRQILISPGRWKIYRHNHYDTGCCANCEDPNCYHGPRKQLYPGYEDVYYANDKNQIVIPGDHCVDQPEICRIL